MKIVDLQVIQFQIPRQHFGNGKIYPPTMGIQSLTKIITDEGTEGYYFGGSGHGDQDGMSQAQISAMVHRLKGMVVGHDPYDREKFWHWMWVANI